MSGAAPPARSLAAGALLASASRVGFVVAGAAVSVLVARLLGPLGTGQFAVITSLFFTLLAVITLGVEAGLAWMVGGRRWAAGSALATSAVVAVALGALGLVVGLLVYAAASGSAFSGVGEGAILLALAALVPALLLLFYSQVAVAEQRYEASSLMNLAQAAAYVAGIGALAAAFGLEGAAGGLLASYTIGAGVALGWARRAVGRRRLPSIDLARLRQAVSFGLRLHVANALAIVIYRFDIFVLNGYRGADEAGFYAVALAATTALGVLPAALSNVLFPRLASLESERAPEAARRGVEDRAIRHTILILAVSSAGLAALLPLLVEPIFGAEFGAAVEPALILIPGAAALGLATTLYAALAGRGRPEYAMRIALVVTPLAIGLYFLLIPSLGAEGAALGSVAAYALSAVLAGASLRRVSGREPPRALLPGRGEIDDYLVLARQLRHRLGLTPRPR